MSFSIYNKLRFIYLNFSGHDTSEQIEVRKLNFHFFTSASYFERTLDVDVQCLMKGDR